MARIRSTEGCDQPVHARGYCHGHWMPWALFCHLLVTSLIPPPVSKLPQYATDSLKALQRGTFVLRLKRILGSWSRIHRQFIAAN